MEIGRVILHKIIRPSFKSETFMDNYYWAALPSFLRMREELSIY